MPSLAERGDSAHDRYIKNRRHLLLNGAVGIIFTFGTSALFPELRTQIISGSVIVFGTELFQRFLRMEWAEKDLEKHRQKLRADLYPISDEVSEDLR